jgi:hypothetical protein
MSINHKAYLFDYEQFAIELKEIIEEALLTDNKINLTAFIYHNFASLKNPDRGGSLDINWETRLRAKDVHEYADLALTKYYEPQNAIGLSDHWTEIDDLLCYEFGDLSLVTLGKPLGPKENFFDPGGMGAYFQSSHQVETNLLRLQDTVSQRPDLLKYLLSTIEMLRQASRLGIGLYVTF